MAQLDHDYRDPPRSFRMIQILPLLEKPSTVEDSKKGQKTLFYEHILT